MGMLNQAGRLASAGRPIGTKGAPRELPRSIHEQEQKNSERDSVPTKADE
jgi:hypothetical protein